MGDRREREDQEESNFPSRQDGLKDTSPPFEVEINAMCMAQDMQIMKGKMDVMMNAMRGWVSTNLDELVKWMDSSFTARETSFSLPTKFRMP